MRRRCSGERRWKIESLSASTARRMRSKTAALRGVGAAAAASASVAAAAATAAEEEEEEEEEDTRVVSAE